MSDDKLKAEIAVEIYRALQKLGAKSDLLSIAGSFGDTLTDQQVLNALRRWNESSNETTG